MPYTVLPSLCFNVVEIHHCPMKLRLVLFCLALSLILLNSLLFTGKLAMAGRLRDWSTLPDSIIQTIAELLQARIDILRLRGVCNSFRSAIPPPILLSPHLKDVHYNFFPPLPAQGPVPLAIKLYTVYLIEPISQNPASTSSAKHDTTKARLIKVRESDSGKVRLLDPFTSLHYKHLHHMLPKCLNLFDYRVTEIAKEYGLEYAEDCERFFCLPRKVAISADHGGELVLMTLVDSIMHMWTSGDKKWVHVSGFGPRYLMDVIYHKGKFYFLAADGLVIRVDPETLKKHIIALPLRPTRSSRGLKSFLRLRNGLFMVNRVERSDGRCRINIYKFEMKGWWEPVQDGIGNNALLLFEGGNLFLSAKEFNVFKGNCVYLPGRVQNDFDNGYPGKVARIFGFQHRTTDYLTAFPGFSEIFWPPPKWAIPKSNYNRLAA